MVMIFVFLPPINVYHPGKNLYEFIFSWTCIFING